MTRANAIQDRAAGKIDAARARETDRSVMDELDRMAERAVAVPIANRAHAIAFLRFVSGHAFRRLCGFDSRHETRAYFGKLASGEDFRGLVRARERADRLFHANDQDQIP